jgi:membrane complex biogenesis BtpA family protein
MDFARKPVIGCVHLLPTLGSHQHDGDVQRIYDTAVAEAQLMLDHGVDALIVENFRDGPFPPDRVPVETVATLAGVTREIVRCAGVPVGVAVLRNDAEAAMAIATATGASFIRVNVHVGAALAAQGLLQGRSHATLRLRAALKSGVSIYADAGVKHSTPWAYPDLADEVRDLSSCADAIIVSGSLTAVETEPEDLRLSKRSTLRPVLVGSGATPENLHRVFGLADGFIVGSYFKRDNHPFNGVDVERVERFMGEVRRLRETL